MQRSFLFLCGFKKHLYVYQIDRHCSQTLSWPAEQGCTRWIQTKNNGEWREYSWVSRVNQRQDKITLRRSGLQICQIQGCQLVIAPQLKRNPKMPLLCGRKTKTAKHFTISKTTLSCRRGLRVSNSPHMHICGRWEEAREPRENLCRHREYKQNPSRGLRPEIKPTTFLLCFLCAYVTKKWKKDKR